MKPRAALGIDKIHRSWRVQAGPGRAHRHRTAGRTFRPDAGRAWKQKTYSSAWQQGDTLSVGIGQGYVTVTPLQLVQQAARLASGKAVSAAPGAFGRRQGRAAARGRRSWISPTRRWRGCATA